MLLYICFMNNGLNLNRLVYVLDCPNPPALAGFYSTVLGWSIAVDQQSPEWVNVYPPQSFGSSIYLGFQLVEDYVAPQWPDGPVAQQAHLDLYVDSIATAEGIVVASGGKVHDHQPSKDGKFRVFLDPVGHPFCLCEDLPVH